MLNHQLCLHDTWHIKASLRRHGHDIAASKRQGVLP
jgi:hypothetical protein